MNWVVVIVAAAAVATVSASLASYPEQLRGGHSRIVSGWDAAEGQFPHQISLRMVYSEGGTVISCGASLIHHDWALTAAHCTALYPTVIISIGATNLTRPVYLFESTEYYNHPEYEEDSFLVQANDIGVIKFPISVEYSALVQPIRLQNSADKNKNYEGLLMEASGWGDLWSGGDSPEVLNWVYLRGVTNEFCLDSFGGNSFVQPSTVCTLGFNATSQSTCHGDSGGPLTIIDVDGKLTQVGVASFVSLWGCHIGFPAGFVRPGHYHDWLQEITGVSYDWEWLEAVEEPSEEAESEDSSSLSQEHSSRSSQEASSSSQEDSSNSSQSSSSSQEDPSISNQDYSSSVAEDSAE